MDLRLDDHTAFVIGGSRGIGAAAARVLAAEGCDVYVGTREQRSAADDTVAAVRSQGREGEAVQFNVCDADTVDAAADQLTEAVEALDVLVLCADAVGITGSKEIEPSEWEAVVDSTLNGVSYALRALVPLLRDGAAVVTVASVAADTGASHHAPYAAARKGLIGLTKEAARSLAPQVRVNCLAPGLTETRRGRQALASLPDDYVEEKLLADDVARPEEMARWIAFLASPISGFMYGATVEVDGGRSLREDESSSLRRMDRET